MGEKVYKPIVKDGDHLIRSKDNPDRVRGLTRDENNQNPDIIEWEEYDVDDLRSDDYTPYPPEEQRIQLTPEQEEFAQQVGEALGAAIVVGGILLLRKVISLVEEYCMVLGQGKGPRYKKCCQWKEGAKNYYNSKNND